MTFTFIDLFAGIGGFRLGMERLGGRCVFSSEIDKHAAATYERNFGHRPAGDITKIAAEEVPDHEVLCGGFPCQPFSVSGKQLGFEDARGTLFFEVMRIVSAKRPKAVFLENVANYVKHQGGKTLQRTVDMLEEAGYATKWDVLNASDYGVPQARKRLYIVGIRKDVAKGEFSFPPAEGRRVRLKDFLLKNGQAARWVINRDDISIDRTDVSELLERRPNRPIQIGRINKGGQGERIYSIEGHAITLSAHGGGAAAKTGAYLVDGKVRKLDPIECRRLMGFPEEYQIDPRPGQAYKQFGNAVVADVIEAVGRQIMARIG
ncbi:DNA (cytosine-5-)-methyltransferase [Pelagicoccus sp. SDUM812003]|uniref:DNA (cytosine-5-)-methyltransferase n=1 Tax=Pelagicoccus sp. SDUM812003 TaxID=3041267 RepID=UPI00280DE91E|nr:DNA (cytosine-5-)-methyltransferase [Pelagicoccus sp. SDUM812003]MDQ8205651.1 DNA (cytosine-5-)-methyltransferase [Pelagicoccus sp. SDUM812003]